MIVQERAPRRIGKNRELRDDRVERRTTPARRDRDVLAFHIEVEIGVALHFAAQAVTGARGLTLFEQRLCERPQHGDVFLVRIIAGAGGERLFGNQLIQRVVAQIVLHEHALGARFARHDFLRLAIDDHIQRQRRPEAPLSQRERFDDAIGQHRDLVARHIDGRQTRAGDRIDIVATRDAERRRGDVHADPHAAVCQMLDGERIVDFSGGDVVDRERLHVGFRQIFRQRADRDRRKTGAVREKLGEEFRLVQCAGRRNPAAFEHQPRLRNAARRGRAFERLVFDRVLVRLGQQSQRLAAAEAFRQAARLQFRLRSRPAPAPAGACASSPASAILSCSCGAR